MSKHLSKRLGEQTNTNEFSASYVRLEALQHEELKMMSRYQLVLQPHCISRSIIRV